MSVHPEVLWAQRSSALVDEKNIVYLTINLPNIDPSSLKFELTSTGISFEADTENLGTPAKHYAFSLDFYSEIVPDLSTKKLSDRSYFIILRKKEKNAEYWPRLTKEKVRNAFIKTDFSRWVDEDEQDSVDPALDDDFGGMGGMGGMPGGMPGGLGGDMDFEKMMSQMGGLGGGADDAGPSGAGGSEPAGDADDDESDEDSDDGPPPLEEVESTK
ncbi:HSP20-like chaperone [Pisolithus croceorrhizus]|nr:HSP20-like chaperone [Pisolithus croceorrhizus]KAI6110702.1 HSP20-like chaperone [Pisolithus croceorrhizus]KAI6159823.1 HSP20-like chaperone [Pisolithus thermaeus]